MKEVRDGQQQIHRSRRLACIGGWSESAMAARSLSEPQITLTDMPSGPCSLQPFSGRMGMF
jgi:hypothetical protein